MDDTELIPCPTCGLPADVNPPGVCEDFPTSFCPRGHRNSLIPAVLFHLRHQAQMAALGFDKCGKPGERND